MALAAGPAWTAADDSTKPQRIVSLDLCADQLLIELVERRRIAAVTHLAADPEVSTIWDSAKGLPVTRGAAEDVLAHKPDLVLAGPFGVAPTVDVLRRLGANVVVVPMASDLDGVRTAVRTVATAAREEAKGEAMIQAFDRNLAQVAAARGPARGQPQGQPQGPPPTALLYQVGGLVLAPGSIGDAALAAAGLRNKAAEYRLTRAGQVPLELLVAAPPDLIVLSRGADQYRTVASDNLRHPALAALRQRHASVELPSRLLLCGTPHVADAIALLAEARTDIEARRR